MDDYDVTFYLYDIILSLHTEEYQSLEGMQYMCVHVLVTKSISKGHVSTRGVGTGGMWGGGTPLTL